MTLKDRKILRMKKLLKYIEFVDRAYADYICLFCNGGAEERTHSKNCKLAKEIR